MKDKTLYLFTIHVLMHYILNRLCNKSVTQSRLVLSFLESTHFLLPVVACLLFLIDFRQECSW